MLHYKRKVTLRTKLIILLMAIMPTLTFAQNSTRKGNYEEFIAKFKKTQLTPETFKEALVVAGLPKSHVEQIYKHARSESGNFKSKVFRENNNAFGMRLPKRRTTTAIGKNRGYAIYKDWYDSVYDYWLWYERKPIASNQSWGTYLRSRNYMNPKDKKK
jgi:hypothetical protein